MNRTVFYFLFERFCQAYGDGWSIIRSADGHNGFTVFALECDIVVLASSEVDGFRVGSVSDAKFRCNVDDGYTAAIDVFNDAAGDVVR